MLPQHKLICMVKLVVELMEDLKITIWFINNNNQLPIKFTSNLILITQQLTCIYSNSINPPINNNSKTHSANRTHNNLILMVCPNNNRFIPANNNLHIIPICQDTLLINNLVKVCQVSINNNCHNSNSIASQIN